MAGSDSQGPTSCLLQEEAPGSPAKGSRETKHRSRREQARARAATNLLAGGATRTGEPPWKPFTGEETSLPRAQGRSPCGQGTLAKGDSETSRKQEQGGPASPTGPAKGEQTQAGVPWLLATIKQEQPGPVGYLGTTDLERPRGEGPCRPESVKQGEPEGLKRPQAEAPCQPRSVKQEEGGTSWAEYQEN